MTRGNRTALLLPLIAAALAASTTAEARGCFVTENDRRSISIRAGSDDAEVTIGTYPEDVVGEGNPTCIVSVSVELSSFPTSRLATRPREVAESIRDVVAELKA